LIALEEVKENVGEKYTHIIVDEAQDLTKVQFDIIRLIYKEKKYSSIYFIADTAQSIYSHAWMVNGRNFTSIGFDMTGRSSSLTKNYRTTTQIAQAAYSLIERDSYIIENENFVKPTLIDRQSSYPVFTKYKKRKDEIKATIQTIKELSEKYKYNEIAVISKSNKHLNYIEGEFNRNGLKTSKISSENADFQSDTVKLLTIHSVKGLEFKVVFIVGINQGVIPFLKDMDEEEKAVQESNERRLFYVGMTRAKELLYLSSFGVASPFINDINPNYLQLDKDALFKKYFQIRIKDYFFSEKINPYNSKESVRQWMINQLIEEYGYKEKDISIDHKLDVFLVDIVINKGELIDIAILVNPYFTGIDDLYYRLKQFNNEKYNKAIITDGNRIKIFDSELNLIKDIPKYKDVKISDSIEKFEYRNLLTKKKFILSRDCYYPEEITQIDDQEEVSYSKDKTIRVSIYGKIAAGKPIDINQEIDAFYLPTDFEVNDNTFMLQVRGDSMIGADINDGDIVVINKQTSANNWDIVAAVIDESVTLKRLSKMGDYIALISENPKYEAISLKDEQLTILGVVVGVIKKL
jgi:SOS regulatory protein LexA